MEGLYLFGKKTKLLKSHILSQSYQDNNEPDLFWEDEKDIIDDEVDSGGGSICNVRSILDELEESDELGGTNLLKDESGGEEERSVENALFLKNKTLLTRDEMADENFVEKDEKNEDSFKKDEQKQKIQQSPSEQIGPSLKRGLEDSGSDPGNVLNGDGLNASSGRYGESSMIQQDRILSQYEMKTELKDHEFANEAHKEIVERNKKYLDEKYRYDFNKVLRNRNNSKRRKTYSEDMINGDSQKNLIGDNFNIVKVIDAYEVGDKVTVLIPAKDRLRSESKFYGIIVGVKPPKKYQRRYLYTVVTSVGMLSGNYTIEQVRKIECQTLDIGFELDPNIDYAKEKRKPMRKISRLLYPPTENQMIKESNGKDILKESDGCECKEGKCMSQSCYCYKNKINCSSKCSNHYGEHNDISLYNCKNFIGSLSKDPIVVSYNLETQKIKPLPDNQIG